MNINAFYAKALSDSDRYKDAVVQCWAGDWKIALPLEPKFDIYHPVYGALCREMIQDVFKITVHKERDETEAMQQIWVANEKYCGAKSNTPKAALIACVEAIYNQRDK